MLFLLMLLGFYAMTWLLRRDSVDARGRWRLALGAAMVVAGVLHLAQPGPFVQHLPTWLPARELLVAASGLAEVALGLGVTLPHRRQRSAGVLLGLLLVAVFPANVYVAVAGIDVEGQPGGLYPWVRLGFQPLFVWLAVWSTRRAAMPGRTRELAA